MTARLVVFLAAATLALGIGAAAAQYPPPGGAITLTPSVPNPTLNSDVAFVVRLQTSDGKAAGNVACTASIASQPGSAASVSPESFSTSADGSANLTLHAGSDAGQVKVAVKCGVLGASTTLSVGNVPLPPETGQGAASNENPSPSTWFVGGATALLIASVYAAYRLARLTGHVRGR